MSDEQVVPLTGDPTPFPPPSPLPPLAAWRRTGPSYRALWLSSGDLPGGGLYEILAFPRPNGGRAVELACHVHARHIGPPMRPVGPADGFDSLDEAHAAASLDYELAQREDHEVLFDGQADEWLVLPRELCQQVEEERESLAATPIHFGRRAGWKPAQSASARKAGAPQRIPQDRSVFILGGEKSRQGRRGNGGGGGGGGGPRGPGAASAPGNGRSRERPSGRFPRDPRNAVDGSAGGSRTGAARGGTSTAAGRPSPLGPRSSGPKVPPKGKRGRQQPRGRHPGSTQQPYGRPAKSRP
jgi:hypothetical protein